MQKVKDVTGVYQKDDGRYVVRATATCPRKNRIVERQRTMPEGATLQMAVERREILKEAIRNPAPEEGQTPGLEDITTLGDYSELWLEGKAENLKPSTADLYFSVLDNRVLPVLGEIRVRELSRAHAQKWVSWADAQDKPGGGTYSVATRRSWWRVCKQLLMDAAADFHVPHNPTRRVKPPKRDGGKHRTTTTLSPEELALFLEAFRSAYTNRYPEVAVMASTGMRAGEAYGLKWTDIDWSAGLIFVRRSVTRGTMTNSTKSGGSREVPLFDSVAQVLREHRKAMMEDDHPGLESGLVFPSDAGTPRFSGSIHKCMVRVSEKMEALERVTPQVLRRTVNTLGRTRGHSEEALRQVLGHAGVEMTDHYTGLSTDDRRQVLKDALGDVFEG